MVSAKAVDATFYGGRGPGAYLYLGTPPLAEPPAFEEARVVAPPGYLQSLHELGMCVRSAPWVRDRLHDNNPAHSPR